MKKLLLRLVATMDISGQDELMGTDGDVFIEVSIQILNNFFVQCMSFFCTIVFFLFTVVLYKIFRLPLKLVNVKTVIDVATNRTETKRMTVSTV